MRLTRIAVLLSLAVICLFSFVGCKNRDGRADEELVVLCGSSFVKPSEKLFEEFTAATGVKIAFSSAGSEDFLPQVKAAQLGDVLITHDPFLDYVSDAGFLGDLSGRHFKQVNGQLPHVRRH